MRKHVVIAALALVSAFAIPRPAQAGPTSRHRLHVRPPATTGIITCDRQGCRPENPGAAQRARASHARNALRRHGHSAGTRRTRQRASLGDSASPLDGLKLTPRQHQTISALVREINRKLDRYVRRTGDCGGADEQLATFYWQGRRTANGERFNPHGMTAASRHLAFGTRLRIRNPRNGREVSVRINDRGPYTKADLDLSLGTAHALGLRQSSYVCVSRL